VDGNLAEYFTADAAFARRCLMASTHRPIDAAPLTCAGVTPDRPTARVTKR
jgi:hypothetical protein